MLEANCPLEINFRPFLLDNVEHWQVFKDDEQILRFIHNVNEFLNFKANDQEENKEYYGEGDQFNNPIPRGLVAL